MTNLRRIRKQERLTMQALADLSGVSESAIGMYETGKRKPSFEVLLHQYALIQTKSVVLAFGEPAICLPI